MDIWIHELDLKKLIRILNLLPKLDSLRLQSIKFDDQMNLSNEEQQIFSSVISKNQITKVYLETIESIGQFSILTTLFVL